MRLTDLIQTEVQADNPETAKPKQKKETLKETLKRLTESSDKNPALENSWDNILQALFPENTPQETQDKLQEIQTAWQETDSRKHRAKRQSAIYLKQALELLRYLVIAKKSLPGINYDTIARKTRNLISRKNDPPDNNNQKDIEQLFKEFHQDYLDKLGQQTQKEFTKGYSELSQKIQQNTFQSSTLLNTSIQFKLQQMRETFIMRKLMQEGNSFGLYVDEQLNVQKPLQEITDLEDRLTSLQNSLKEAQSENDLLAINKLEKDIHSTDQQLHSLYEHCAGKIYHTNSLHAYSNEAPFNLETFQTITQQEFQNGLPLLHNNKSKQCSFPISRDQRRQELLDELVEVQSITLSNDENTVDLTKLDPPIDVLIIHTTNPEQNITFHGILPPVTMIVKQDLSQKTISITNRIRHEAGDATHFLQLTQQITKRLHFTPPQITQLERQKWYHNIQEQNRLHPKYNQTDFLPQITEIPLSQITDLLDQINNYLLEHKLKTTKKEKQLKLNLNNIIYLIINDLAALKNGHQAPVSRLKQNRNAMKRLATYVPEKPSSLQQVIDLIKQDDYSKLEEYLNQYLESNSSTQATNPLAAIEAAAFLLHPTVQKITNTLANTTIPKIVSTFTGQTQLSILPQQKLSSEYTTASTATNGLQKLIIACTYNPDNQEGKLIINCQQNGH